jgi:hypothetical protein
MAFRPDGSLDDFTLMEFLEQAAHAWTNSRVSTLHTKATHRIIMTRKRARYGTSSVRHAHLKADAMHVTDANRDQNTGLLIS